MEIKKVKKSNCNELARLYKQFWGDEQNINKMAKMLELTENDASFICLGAFSDGKMIATISASTCLDLYGECQKYAVIENFVIDEQFRRQGIGWKLMSEIEKHLQKLNCSQMILITENNRDDACSFYKKYGFSTNTIGFKKKICKLQFSI